MLLWSAALAAFLLLVAWGGSNWKAFHLVYCRHLLASRDVGTRLKGLGAIADTHLRAGLTREEVRRLFGVESVRDEDWGCEVSAGGDGLRLKFDAAGRLDSWWWYP